MKGVLKKLPGIKAELFQGHQDWQSWNFTKLLYALRARNEIYPCDVVKSREAVRLLIRLVKEVSKRKSPAQTHHEGVYTAMTPHAGLVNTLQSEPQQIERKIHKRRDCFNFTGPYHSAHCRGRVSCAHCKQKHYTLILDRATQGANNGAAMRAAHTWERVCHPAVLQVNGLKFRALLNTGATASYTQIGVYGGSDESQALSHSPHTWYLYNNGTGYHAITSTPMIWR